MLRDKVVEEVRKARDSFAARFGYSIEAMGRELRRLERADGRRVVSFVKGRPHKRPVKAFPSQEGAKARRG